MNYYNRHIGDYLKSTAHLSLLEHGVYSRLMDVYYVRESGLHQDNVARLVGARSKDELAALSRVLEEFFELVAGIWVQHRCEREIEAFSDKSMKSKRSAKTRWEDDKTNDDSNANAMRTHTERNADAMPRGRVPIPNNQYPITNTQKNTKNTSAIAPPGGVSLSIWADFTAHRKEKKAKLTQTAIDGIQREATRAGWTLEAALTECCARGWTGFKADWVADKPTAKPAQIAESFRERDARIAAERMAELAPGIARKQQAFDPEFTETETRHVVAIASH